MPKESESFHEEINDNFQRSNKRLYETDNSEFRKRNKRLCDNSKDSVDNEGEPVEGPALDNIPLPHDLYDPATVDVENIHLPAEWLERPAQPNTTPMLPLLGPSTTPPLPVPGLSTTPPLPPMDQSTTPPLPILQWQRVSQKIPKPINSLESHNGAPMELQWRAASQDTKMPTSMCQPQWRVASQNIQMSFKAYTQNLNNRPNNKNPPMDCISISSRSSSPDVEFVKTYPLKK